MTSMINLEDMPNLVLEKITSFLTVKQLLTLELVSSKMKDAVNAHFCTTDHLIIGFLPEVEIRYSVSYDEVTTKDKKYLDGLVSIIKRCGIRLRTIQVNVTFRFPYTSTLIRNYNIYFSYLFASAEMSENCPNIENIITFPKLDSYTILVNKMFRKQNIMLNGAATEIYAETIKLSKGKTCKLRSITLYNEQEIPGINFFKRTLSLYSNLEQLTVDDHDDSFIEFLPQFIMNGLKDLNVLSVYKIQHVKKYCEIGRDLRTLRFTDIEFEDDDDIEALMKLEPSKNLELGVRIGYVNDSVTHLSENVFNSIIKCEVPPANDYSLLSKLKNVKEFDVCELAQLKAIAEGPFPELKQIRYSFSCFCHAKDPCVHGSWFCLCQKLPKSCDLQTFLPQILIDKGNQLIFIEISNVCRNSVDVVWKALKHCKAAKFIEFGQCFVDSQLTVTYEDVNAIFLLPNLQQFTFTTIQKDDTRKKRWYTPWRKQKSRENDTCDLLPELMKRAVTEHNNFQFEFNRGRYSLDRIHF